MHGLGGPIPGRAGRDDRGRRQLALYRSAARVASVVPDPGGRVLGELVGRAQAWVSRGPDPVGRVRAPWAGRPGAAGAEPGMVAAMPVAEPGVVAGAMAGAEGVVAGAVARPGSPAGPGLGYLATLRLRHRLVARHLRRIYGPGLTEAELERRVSDSFASYARYWAESLRLPSVSLEQVQAGLASDGFEHLFAALGRRGGVIVALPHLGGWEWAGTWMARRGYPVSVVVEALEPPEVFDWFVRFRRALGLEVITVGPGAGAASLRALRANRVLCLLCDRVVGQTPGVKVELFGAPTMLPAGPVTLALRSGAPLVAGAVYYAPGRPDHLAVIRPPLPLERHGSLRDDVRRGTQALAAELEVLIRRAPTQWHMMQPNWPGDPG